MKAERELHRAIVALGFELVRDRNHRVYRHPKGGPSLTVHATGGKGRGHRNALGDARRIARSVGAL